ncbi:MAG: Sporulation kinase D [Syntrophorhabdus sp. PtaB.Bin047]|jgi:signal transduction histidine kinase|nr:MAG: Sporulation kinase D [Syntrophorhabdus sp. PtaB.Bin047]
MTQQGKKGCKADPDRTRSLEIALEEERSLSRARSTLLETNIKELNDVYAVLNEKLKALRFREERIKRFEGELVRANKLSSLGELAGSIAHEIKNPLISVQGFAKRIAKTGDIARIRRYAELIDQEAGRMANVLVKLLDFSRMDEPRGEECDLHDIVDDTVLFMEHHLTRFKNVTVEVRRSTESAIVRVDRIHIQQALVNLINNAAQAMPKGGAIRISSGTDSGLGFITVADEGDGIDEETLERIFEPFFTTKPKGEGTGLGLSLSRKLLEANGGSIDVETHPGEGSAFTMRLPLAR